MGSLFLSSPLFRLRKQLLRQEETFLLFFSLIYIERQALGTFIIEGMWQLTGVRAPGRATGKSQAALGE